MASKYVYRSFNKSTTCIGVLSDDSDVKPTISEKYIVTQSNISALTVPPRFNSFAMLLKFQYNYQSVEYLFHHQNHKKIKYYQYLSNKY